MIDKEVTKKEFAAFQRFLRLLPHGQDLSLVLLKGHLLIEEQVRQFIDERVEKPEALGQAELTCKQAICIAEAFCPEGDDVWASVKKLNKIRNKLAHNVEPSGLDDQIDDFIKSAQWFDSHVKGRQERVEFAIWALFDAVSALVKHPTAAVIELKKG